MKKFLLSSLALLAVVTASAQYYPNGRPIPPRHRNVYYGRTSNYYRTNTYPRYGNTYYGVRIGLGLSTVNSDALALDANSPRTGLNIGVAVGTQLTPAAPLFVESGLYYTEKGGKSTYNNQDFTFQLNYLELPVVLKYKAYAAPGMTIEPFVGGYASVGVGGNIKDYSDRQAYSSFSSNDPNSFRRLDAGIKLGVGASFRMLYLEASYDIGLANVGHYQFEDTRTGCLNLNLGFNF